MIRPDKISDYGMILEGDESEGGNIGKVWRFKIEVYKNPESTQNLRHLDKTELS